MDEQGTAVLRAQRVIAVIARDRRDRRDLKSKSCLPLRKSALISNQLGKQLMTPRVKE
jgi:hypothetical protein